LITDSLCGEKALQYGDSAILDTQKGPLGTYDKGPLYLVAGGDANATGGISYGFFEEAVQAGAAIAEDNPKRVYIAEFYRTVQKLLPYRHAAISG
jgi:hypothetical protein